MSSFPTLSRRFAFALAIGFVVFPAAFADTIDFSGTANGGTWSFTCSPTPNCTTGSTLTATYNTVTVDKGGPTSALPGSVYTFTTGAFTGTTVVSGATTYNFAGGGSISVGATNVIKCAGGLPGGNCFLGSFINCQFLT